MRELRPRAFNTKSRGCIIANDWKNLNADAFVASGVDWVEHLLGEQPERARIVAAILANAEFQTERERVSEFSRGTGASRATYFNWKRKLRGGRH